MQHFGQLLFDKLKQNQNYCYHHVYTHFKIT